MTALPAYVRKGKSSAAIGDFGSATAVSTLTAGTFVQGSAATGITAHAGGTKAAATVLTAQFNRITVCATSADSVLLPAAVVGRVVDVFNDGAAPAQVFGAGTDTIDGVATGTGVVLTNAKRARYICFAAGAWISAQYGVASA